MFTLNFLLTTVVVGLLQGDPVTIDNAQFTGFIETRENGQAFLLYIQDRVHREISTEMISRIEVGYERGEPFPLTVTLRDGRTLRVSSDRRDFLQIFGRAPEGNVTVQHPDPVHGPLRLSTRAPNRSGDLTIGYLEFPPTDDD